MPERKPVGRAIAHRMGQYPTPDGRARIVREGEEFVLVEGLTKGAWFDVISIDEERPRTPPAKAAKPGADAAA